MSDKDYETDILKLDDDVCLDLIRKKTSKAKLFLENKPPFRILIDSNIIGHSLIFKYGWHNTGSTEHSEKNNVWGLNHPRGYLVSKPAYSAYDETWPYNEIVYLTGIYHLAHEGLLQLFSSELLKYEKLYQPTGRYRSRGMHYGDLVLMSHLEMPFIDSTDPGFASFLGHLLTASLQADMGNPKKNSLAKKIRTTLQKLNDEPFRSIRDALPNKNSQDSWHLHTAEKKNLFCFLSMDRKFIKNLNQHRKKLPKLNTKILLPSDFGKMIGLEKIDIRYFKYLCNWPVEDL